MFYWKWGLSCMTARTKFILFSLLSLLIIAGCSKETVIPFPKEKSITIDVGYTQEEHFKRRYASLLDSEYPNMVVNVVSTKELLKPDINPTQWLLKNQVDLIYIPSELLESFVQEGLLTDIEPLMKQDTFDLQQFVPGVIELTREYGNGKLYGLPSSFYSSAIVFNKDLFDKYKIEYPQDQMNWEEILLLTSRFPSSDSSIKGISLKYPNLFDFILHIGKTAELKAYNQHQHQFTLNAKSWVSIWDKVIKVNKTGALDLNPDLNSYFIPFLSGERAMAVISYDEYKRLEQEKPSFKWSTVTMPVNPSQPNQSDSLRLSGVFAIPNSSDNKEAAWELMKFFNSEEVARWEYRSDYGFSSLMDQIISNEDNRETVTPFYKLSPLVDQGNDTLPTEINAISEEIINKISNQSLTVQEGLDILQNEAEKVLSKTTNVP